MIRHSCVILGVVAAAAVARADLLQVSIRGQIAHASGVGAPPVGAEFSYLLIIDSATPDIEPDPSFGVYTPAYPPPPYVLADVSINGQPIGPGAFGATLFVYDNHPLFGDQFTILGSPTSYVAHVQLHLQDLGGNAWSGDAIPFGLSLSQLTSAEFTLSLQSPPFIDWTATGMIGSFEVSAVPPPGTGLLLLGAWVVRARRRM
jgi:hypothetical protein